MSLVGKRVLITGASQGLGFHTASLFASQGARLILCARNQDDVSSAREKIAGQHKSEVIAVAADVSIEQDVSALVQLALDRYAGLDVLICNAGIYGPKGSIDQVDWGEWVRTININLCGAVSCCRLFMPLLRKSSRGKIILLSGGGATKPLPYLSAYAASKAAVVRFGETLAEEVKSAGIDVNSVAPGALNTRMLDEVIAAGAERVGSAFYDAALAQRASGGTSLDAGAALCSFLSSNASDGITGKLISAVWDPWPQLQAHIEDLNRTDVFTLRRIVPSDRGLAW